MSEQEKVTLKDIDEAPTELPPRTVTSEQYQELSDRLTRVSEEKIRLYDELTALRASRDASAILNDLIIPYASRAFWFMCAYCTFVGVMLVVSIFGYRLPDRVMEILVGSTAVTVIGLVGMVLAGVFRGARSTK